MADFLVRDLSDNVVYRLTRQAEAHGRSVEAELRAILETIEEPPSPLSTERWIEGLQAIGWPDDLGASDLRDGPDAGRATYISPEGLDRLGNLLRRG